MSTRPCPYCAEEIQLDAKKCKWCGEIVDPTLRAAGPGPGAVPPGYPPGMPPQANPEVTGADSKSTWALVFGILSIVICCLWFVFGPLAIIMGSMANGVYKRHGLPSNGKATAGIVIGIIMCILGVVGTIVNLSTGAYKQWQ